MTQAEEPTARLAELDARIAEVQGTLDGLRADIGGQGSGALDAEDVAAALTGVEENEAILASLQEQRAAVAGE